MISKRLLLICLSTVGIIALVPLFAAFEAHVVNVTAQIENALTVSTDEIEFGTVFPQEKLQKNIRIALSNSFLEQNRVNQVVYKIKKKPKPRQGIEIFPGNISGHEYCLNNTPTDSGNPSDPYYQFCYPSLCDRLTEVLERATSTTSTTFGMLDVQTNSEDRWQINLAVPCFKRQCDQGYDINYYGSPLDPRLEHELFGCDVWIEVSSISSEYRKTYCGDGVIQHPNEIGIGGPNNDGYEQCDTYDIEYQGWGYHCSLDCTISKCSSGQGRPCSIQSGEEIIRGIQWCTDEGLWGECEIEPADECVDGGFGCTIFYVDEDNDGAGGVDNSCLCQANEIYKVTNTGDCNDTDSHIKPGAPEHCSTSYDDNCSGGNNDIGAIGCTIFYGDNDGDGWGDEEFGSYKCLCEASYPYVISQGGDCNDGNNLIHPDVAEICDGIDNNCNGETDEGCLQRVVVTTEPYQTNLTKITWKVYNDPWPTLDGVTIVVSIDGGGGWTGIYHSGLTSNPYTVSYAYGLGAGSHTVKTTMFYNGVEVFSGIIYLSI